MKPHHIMLTGQASLILMTLIVFLSEHTINASTDLPIGTVLLFSSNVSPSKWILCNGTEISRTAYSSLFDAIGTVYGSGDGNSTFNVPDFRDRFPYGNNEHGSQLPNNHHGGTAEVTLTEQEMPVHMHDQGTLSMNISGEHTHAYDDLGHGHGDQTGENDYSHGSHPMMAATGGKGNDRGRHSHSISRDITHLSIRNNGSHVHEVVGRIANSGYAKPFKTIPSYETVNFIIYAGV